jgi:hypothetical protein
MFAYRIDNAHIVPLDTKSRTQTGSNVNIRNVCIASYISIHRPFSLCTWHDKSLCPLYFWVFFSEHGGDHFGNVSFFGRRGAPTDKSREGESMKRMVVTGKRSILGFLLCVFFWDSLLFYILFLG